MGLADPIKNWFIAGLILVAPLVVTVYLIQILVSWSLRFVDPVVEGTRLTQYTANNDVAAQIVAVVLIIGAITLLGYAAQWHVGRRLFGNFGRVVNLIPLVDTVYSSVRQVANSLVDRNSRYESVVLVEYPRKGVYSVGLVTSESPDEAEAVTGGPAYNVFLPNSPNPTAGRLILVPEDQLYEIDMSVRHGMRLIVTTGMGGEQPKPYLPEIEGDPNLS